MKHSLFLVLALITFTLTAQHRREIPVRENVPTDQIRLSDPFVLADTATHMYYMTGTGGMMWKSSDLETWSGPYRVAETDPQSWMGPRPMIWAAELHQYEGKYYYFATFTNQAVMIDTVRNNAIERRASHVLVSDRAEGPYRPMKDETYLPADRPTLDGTFWVDRDGKPYMIYCWEWLQNWDGTIEKIELKPDLSGSVGEGKILFRASDSPWSRERDEHGNIRPNKVTDGPFLFRTSTGRLGMLWTSWVYDVYTQGVAYSESGTLDGPWIQEPEPITPPNYGHGMLFRTFDGELLLSCHSHKKDAQGRTVRIPHFFKASLDGDRLSVMNDAVEVGPYTVEEIGQDIYHIQDFNHINPSGETFAADGSLTHFNNCSDMYLLVGSTDALLIDLSNYVTWDSTAVSSLRSLVAERIGNRPLTITFTHNHGDHTGMLPAYVNDTSVSFALPRIDFKPLKKNFPKVRYSFYDEGKTFDLGGIRVNTVLVPGHTHGSMVFFVEGRNMVFTGDAIGSGHGVWIFNTKGFEEYTEAVPHLIDYISNPAHGIATDKLTVWGGHYWQKDWFRTKPVKTIDWHYICDMQTLITQIRSGKAYSEPSNLNFRNLDTYFKLGNATIVWNKAEAEALANKKR